MGMNVLRSWYDKNYVRYPTVTLSGRDRNKTKSNVDETIKAMQICIRSNQTLSLNFDRYIEGVVGDNL